MLGSTPAVIERRITLGILRGKYPPGSKLPTVRTLAAHYKVNQATIQRVVARLETRGLVLARQGSGLAVNDPQKVGDMSLIPLWIEASLDDPERAARLLEGVLEVRRVLAVRMLVRNRDELLARITDLAAEAAAVASAVRTGGEALRDADLAFARRMLTLMGNHIALSIFNTLAKVLQDIPAVTQAMYGQPETNLASMMTVMNAIRDGGDGMGETIERSMAQVDRNSVEVFAELLKSKGAKSSKPGRGKRD